MKHQKGMGLIGLLFSVFLMGVVLVYLVTTVQENIKACNSRGMDYSGMHSACRGEDGILRDPRVLLTKDKPKPITREQAAVVMCGGPWSNMRRWGGKFTYFCANGRTVEVDGL